MPEKVQAWWLVSLFVGGSLLIGWAATVLVFAAISFIALREYATLVPTRREDRPVVLFVYAAAPISYGAIFLDLYGYFLVIAPIYMFVGTASLMALIGRTDGFLATAGVLTWGMLICVFNIGHAAFLIRTPADEAGPAGPAGLVFFLIAMTILADAAEAAGTRFLGRTPLSARLGPERTLEGLAVSIAVTGAAFTALSAIYTPLPLGPAAFIGFLLPIWAVMGSLVMAAVKRELGVATSSDLLPGYGGALDRIASLSFTAPWVFHMLAIFALDRF